MNPKIAQKLSAAHFKRRFGVHRATFKRLIKALKPYWRPTAKPGVKPKLALGDRVLVCLEYWREYRTYFHIGSSWGVSEATVYRIVRWVEDHLMCCGQFRLAGKKQLLRGFGKPQVVVMDVTQTPIERSFAASTLLLLGQKETAHPQVSDCAGAGQWANHLHILWALVDDTTLSFIKPLGCALPLRLRACRIKGIKASTSGTPTVVCRTKGQEVGNSVRSKRQIIEL